MNVGARHAVPIHLSLRDPRGVALFMTMMFMVLLLGFSLLMYQNASLERMIAGYVKREVTAVALAESGFEQTLAWFAEPNAASTPDHNFFKEMSCLQGEPYVGEQEIGGVGGTVTISITSSIRRNGICTVKVKMQNGKGIQADVGRNPMPRMTYAVYGADANDPNVFAEPEGLVLSADTMSTSTDMNMLKSFIRRFGRSFHASNENCLKEQESQECKSFNTLFSVHPTSNQGQTNGEKRGYDLVFVDAPKGVTIPPGAYKGYFYFSGNVTITGGWDEGQPVTIKNKSDNRSVYLDGFIYTPAKMTIQDPFSIYGAVYAGSGIAWGWGCLLNGNLPCLKVWYNKAFSTADYAGVAPMIRIPGTWKTM